MSAAYTVPLFLFVSQSNQDTALLATAPSSLSTLGGYSSSTVGDAVWEDYEQVFHEPVAYGMPLDDTTPSYPLVTLRAYWSDERKDFQTTTWSLDELNAHGGNYEFVADVALVASTPGEGIAAAPFTPMRLAYDSARSDAALGPWSFADLNAMIDGAGFKDGRIDAYAKQGDCASCNISFSESFPSKGGADCAYACSSDHSCHTTTYRVGYIDSDAEIAFDANMKKAGEILESFGTASTESGTALHVSLNYLCCYSEYDLATIKNVFSSVEWPALNISFGAPVWRVDSDAEDVDHQSIIVLLDDASQNIMHKWVAELEDMVRAAGVDIHVPRADQEPFHSTLAVVSGSSYPAEAALAAVNEAIPPNTWTPAPITLPAATINW